MNAKSAKHTRVMRVLRSRLLRGVYQGKLPGERVLAAELGTSPKTIQLALVQLEALGMVRRVQRQGTFAVSPGEAARLGGVVYARLVLNVPFTDEGTRDFWASFFIYGFQKAAREHNLNMALEYVDDAQTAVDETSAEARLPECAGTCILAVPLKTKHILCLADAGGPVVIADWDLEEPLIPCLGFDNIGAGRLAAEYLVNLGHRRIGYVRHAKYSETPPSQRDRLQGMEAYLDNVGLGLSHKLIVEGSHDFKRLVDMLRDPNGPTAVICSRFSDAVQIAHSAEVLGKRIPEDLSLLRFGRVYTGRGMETTRINMDLGMLGRRALELLLDEAFMANPRRVLLPVSVVEGNSTAAPPDGA